ncbi:actin organization and endocytosis protein, partial [Ascosphaera aggregata]
MYGSFYSSPYGQGQGQGQASNNHPPQQQMPAYIGIATPPPPPPPLQQYPGQHLSPAGSGMSYLASQPTGFQPPQGPPPQQQRGGLAPAPTGYGTPTQQSLTPQYTTLPQQQQQQQPQLQPTSFAPLASAPPSAAGQTSSGIARSFATGSPAPQSTPTPQRKPVIIPSQRLSFITAADQAKFEQLFRSAVGNGQALEGEKAKDLLLRSRLPGHDLAKIWVLADTTKSGRLLFPEFALAMYLCNLRLTDRELPTKLPERIANEVSSMVDIISFSVPDSAPPPPTTTATLPTNVPDFTTSSNVATTQPSNTALLSSLAPQPTGFHSQQQQQQQPQHQNQQAPNVPSIMAPQPTGFPGTTANQSAMHPQQTGFLNPKQTAFSGTATGNAGLNIPPVPAIPSSFTGAPGNLAAQPTGMAPLAAQPTGIPGQWGFVNAPASGLPNIEALKQQLMPQPGREGGYTTQGLSGNATIPWAVTKDEKRIYDDLFRAWDGFNKGLIGGDVAIEIMGQSGLPREDLERIWTLSDPNNRGKLNMDEFAVAMHLIYRRLNGYPVPARLPPELVPPSTRHLNDSIGQVKSLLSQDADSRKSSGAFLQPQKTGVSYLKDHSFRGTNNSSMPAQWGRKDATMFKNDDDAVPYRSSARRRGGGRSPSPNPEAQQQRPADVDEMSVEQLKKKIHETKIMLDAVDFQDENAAEDEEAMNRRNRREAEDIMERIRRVQENIDNDPKAALRNTDSSAEKRALRRQLQNVQDLLPQLASDVRKTEKLIAEAKMEVFKLKDAKAHPNSMAIVGTGPNGTVTESDRIKARARARMQARAAELTGKPAPTIEDEGEAQRRIDEESVVINAERDRNEAMSRDVEESVKEFSRALEDGLKEASESSTKEHERRRWEEALGVEDVIRDFIYDLQRSSRMTRTRPTSDVKGYDRPSSAYERESQPSLGSPSHPSAYESPSRSMTSTPTSTGASPSPHDRVLSARERAQKRIQERMAAAGLRSGVDAGETLLQRQEREKREREERLKRAEEEDRKREEERQARLAKEGSVSSPAPPIQQEEPPTAVPKKAAPPPPPQKRAEQSAQEAEREGLEAEARRQEEEIAREREAAEARLKALEEQVRQGKLRKQEEKRRKQQAAAEAKEKEQRLARQRKEIEEAAERERKLRAQLESLD